MSTQHPRPPSRPATPRHETGRLLLNLTQMLDGWAPADNLIHAVEDLELLAQIADLLGIPAERDADGTVTRLGGSPPPATTLECRACTPPTTALRLQDLADHIRDNHPELRADTAAMQAFFESYDRSPSTSVWMTNEVENLRRSLHGDLAISTTPMNPSTLTCWSCTPPAAGLSNAEIDEHIRQHHATSPSIILKDRPHLDPRSSSAFNGLLRKPRPDEDAR